MTIQDFIDECERTTGNGKIRLMPDQRAVYYQKLRRFTDEQLSAIYDKVLELTEHFPKIKIIYDAAEKLGFLEEPPKSYEPHVWEKTDCPFCAGEGLLSVTWERTFEKLESGVYEIMQLDRIRPYSSVRPSSIGPNATNTVFRCKCLAGEAKGVPKGIPRWNTDVDPVRRRLMAR